LFGLGADVAWEALVAEDVELPELDPVDVEEELELEVVLLELRDVVLVEVELLVMELVADALRDDIVPVVPAIANGGVKL
jgi:hypothetical protein